MRIQLACCLLIAPVLGVAQMRCDEEPPRAVESAEVAMDASIHEAAARAKALAALERERFAARFNRLVVAVKEFSEEYNKGGGAIWPQRKADEVEKAYRELQKVDSWRRSTYFDQRKNTPAVREQIGSAPAVAARP